MLHVNANSILGPKLFFFSLALKNPFYPLWVNKATCMYAFQIQVGS